MVETKRLVIHSQLKAHFKPLMHHKLVSFSLFKAFGQTLLKPMRLLFLKWHVADISIEYLSYGWGFFDRLLFLQGFHIQEEA